MDETTTVVPLDGLGRGGVLDSEGRGAVQTGLVFFGGGAVPDGGGRGAVQIELVFSGGGASAVVVWHPPLQLVTTTVEVVRVV